MRALFEVLQSRILIGGCANETQQKSDLGVEIGLRELRFSLN